ncbi:zinc knuckle CX2CX4HX4C containing protein [Tanacetum coccineum]
MTVCPEKHLKPHVTVEDDMEQRSMDAQHLDQQHLQQHVSLQHDMELNSIDAHVVSSKEHSDQHHLEQPHYITIHRTSIGSGSDGATKRGAAEGINIDSTFKQVHPEKVHVSALINDEKVLGANVAIPIVVVDEIGENFANTLYGYFIGEQLALPIVEAYVKNAWANYGYEHSIFRNGFFFFKFSSHDGIVKTLDGGPWFIRSMPIFLNVWSINTKLKREEITKGRNSYARVLVELSSDCDVKETIVVAIPLPKGPKGEGKLFCEHLMPVSKPSTFIENTSKPNSNAPPVSKEIVKGADIEPNLRSNIKKLMDEDKVLELNTNNVTDGVVDTMNSTPNLKNVSTNTKSVLVEAKGSENGSLWEQFSMTHAVSTSQPKSSMPYTNESDEDEVYMPDVLPGRGFLDDMEGDLDCYNGYEAQVYDIVEKDQVFCDQYDIRLNRCCRK